MQISVRISQVNLKFIQSQVGDKISIGRRSIYFLLYLAERKYRDGNESADTPIDDVLYSTHIQFDCSLSQWLKLRIKGNDANIVVTSFNRLVRDFFYQDYFQFMNVKLLEREIKGCHSLEIKGFAQDYMDKLSLSDDDIDLQTLLRNYRRYRLSPNSDLYTLIESLHDNNPNTLTSL